MSRQRKANSAYLWKLFWGLVLLGAICKYWYISLPILSLIALSFILDAREKAKSKLA